MNDFTPADRAGLCLALLLRMPEAEQVAALQALQQLVQAELARLWARAASPGHAWSEELSRRCIAEAEPGLFTRAGEGE